MSSTPGRRTPRRRGAGASPWPATLRDATSYSTNSTIFVGRKDRKLEFQISFMETQREAFLTGLVASQSGRGFVDRGANRGFIVKYRPIPSLQLSFAKSLSRAFVREGAGYQQVDGGKLSDRTVVGAYLEDEWKLRSNVSLVAGARLDSYFGYGEERDLSFNPRVSVAWSALDWLLIKALYASSVRPPSAYERFGNFRAPLVGNAGVRAERVQTAELSLVLRNERL
ncbi:MAG: TonB-dependent receptor domain-containing protein, partial [Myxococcaceae bacterium]